MRATFCDRTVPSVGMHCGSAKVLAICHFIELVRHVVYAHGKIPDDVMASTLLFWRFGPFGRSGVLLLVETGKREPSG